MQNDILTELSVYATGTSFLTGNRRSFRKKRYTVFLLQTPIPKRKSVMKFDIPSGRHFSAFESQRYRQSPSSEVFFKKKHIRTLALFFNRYSARTVLADTEFFPIRAIVFCPAARAKDLAAYCRYRRNSFYRRFLCCLYNGSCRSSNDGALSCPAYHLFRCSIFL